MRPVTRFSTLALLAVFLAGCDILGLGAGPPAGLSAGYLPGGLVVGESVDVSVTVTDDEGTKLEDETVHWTTAAGSVADASSTTDADGVASTRWTLGTTAGPQSLTATVGSLEVTFDAEARPDEFAELLLSPADTLLEAVGDSLRITTEGRDQYGNGTTVPSLVWSSSAPSVASVSRGIVVSEGEGLTQISATNGSVSGSTGLEVDQVMTGVAVDPVSYVMVIGETVSLTAEGVDARGTPIDTTLAIVWTSSDSTVATVSDSGVVTSVDTGIAVITAAADALDGTASMDVRDGERPTITGISPSVLAEGDTATITGTGFPTDTATVDVTVDDEPMRVLSTTSTELIAEMPGPSTFPCAPTGDRTFAVFVDGLESTADHPVAGAPQYGLAVGESAVLFGDDVACAELVEAGSYVVSVSNASTVASGYTAFQLRGTAASSALAADGPVTRHQIDVDTEPEPLDPDPELEAHLRIMEENRRLVEALGTPDTDPDGPRIAAQAVGDLRTFRIPDIDEGDICDNYVTVGARAAYVGEYGVVWEDTLAPLAGQMDTMWDKIGAEYDQVMHQVLLDYFGDPLVYDDRLDANGKFFMLFSKTVNDFERGVAGFVFSGDFYDRETECASSDEGEIFYGWVPTQSGDGFDRGQIRDWYWRIRSTVIHEVKHLTSYANKFDVSPDSPNREESGLEEATARLSEEFFGRALQGYTQGDNVGYDASIWCERRVGSNYPACDSVPLIMLKHYSGINAHMKSPELLSPFGRVDPNDWTFYGSGWQWVRWAIDQSGVPEADFIKALVREPDLVGPENLADKAGRTVAELLADYTASMAVDDHPSGTLPTRSALTMPGWDTRDIFDGLYEDHKDDSGTPSSFYPTPWPLASHAVSGGDFQVDVPEIHGGSASIIELDTATGRQLLELLASGGGTAPDDLGLTVVRVQ